MASWFMEALEMAARTLDKGFRIDRSLVLEALGPEGQNISPNQISTWGPWHDAQLSEAAKAAGFRWSADPEDAALLQFEKL